MNLVHDYTIHIIIIIINNYFRDEITGDDVEHAKEERYNQHTCSLPYKYNNYVCMCIIIYVQ